MAAKPPPPTHRVRVENEMIKRREKQFRYEQMWNGRKQYYEHWEKKNAKFDEWTSPRYHETNNKLIEDIKKKREHEDNLQKRREKLRKLLHEEENLYQIELMIHKTKNSVYAKPKIDEVPTEVLKELNLGLKLEEDDRRRHEAELKLYHQWRNNNPVLKHYERMQRSRDLKLSWLDQQIENRMRKEKEEEECRKILKEREKMLREEQAREEDFQKRIEAKKEELKANLEQQIDELKRKTQLSEDLRRKEEEECRKKIELDKIEAERIDDERKKLERECALYNIKQYKMRLKKKAENIQENLKKERELILKLKELEVAERIEDEAKKNEVKEAIAQFLVLNEEQKKLERCRQRHLDFLFDSEAKVQYQQQDEFWKQEEAARAKLIKDVLTTIQTQIDNNMKKHKEKQARVIKEREEMVARIEAYNSELKELKEEETRTKRERMRSINEEVKVKNAKKKERENTELRKIDEELERVRKEEERLKREIMNIQRRQGPIRPTRSKLFF
ncbi:Trichoplein and/or EVC2 like domain containing protein [Asbolus verrucosus]|uniref:Trichoplein and/or EVC2 like domain containing protein n=1 Tax=Asbolus verrucosus TaxID=1661398 RepID=A0A482VDL7_ASBVE|nr:Trichoplein and/or EVC2 like domain containing protein [Asbolus verrucosus]